MSKLSCTPLVLFATTLLMTAGRLAVGQSIPSIVNSPDNPLQVISITGTPNDLMSAVSVRNLTDKTISSYRLGFVMAVPPGCGTNPHAEPIVPSRLIQLAVVPKGETKSFDHGLVPKTISTFRSQYSAKFVQSQVTVLEVNFSDGSKWKLNATPGQTFDEKLLAIDGRNNCSSDLHAQLVRASFVSHCSVAQNATGGGYYKCVDANNQTCSNSADGRSCTSIV